MNKREAAVILRCVDILKLYDSYPNLTRARNELEAMAKFSQRKPAKRIPQVRKGKPRKGPMRDPEYRKWLRVLNVCIIARLGVGPRGVCDDEWLNPDAAHTANNGMRSKGPDSSCVPLCRKHHEEYDAGRAAFEKKYGVDCKALAAEHFARYEKESGRDSG